MSVYRFCCLVCLFLSTAIFAQVPRDPLVANGYAVFSEFGQDIFCIALFLPETTTDLRVIRQTANKRIEIKVLTDKWNLRRFSTSLVKRSAINNSPQQLKDNAAAMAEMLAAFKGNLTRGDHIVISQTEGGIVVAVNSVALVSIAAPQLFDMLLNTWVGSVPPSRDFRGRLLAAENAQEYKGLFDTVIFRSSRLLTIEQWLDQGDVASAASATIAAEVSPSFVQASSPTPTPLVKLTPKLTMASELSNTIDDVNDQAKVVAKAIERPVQVSFATPTPIPEPRPLLVSPTPSPEREPESNNEAERFSAENLLAFQLYTSALLAKTQRSMQYPNISHRLRHSGTVVASVTINRQGKVVKYQLLEQSKYPPLNVAVKKGIRRASPYPQLPELVEGDEFTFQVPVTFKYTR